VRRRGIGIHLKRRKTLGKAGVVALLIAAALALSGCWANVYNFSDGTRNITLTSDFTRRLVTTCGDEHGNGSARDFCVLDKINGVCFHFPEKGVTTTDCVELSNYGDWEDMDTAINNVIGTTDCLSYFQEKHINDNFWGSVSRGIFGCK
jgi:hypothetical protein